MPTENRRLSHRRPCSLDTFYFGATYYPEHWDNDARAEDADRMAGAGFNCVRMAEFAWDLMEPEEGRYEFALFDDTIARLGEKGIQTILCTPTATPPRWLTLNHPSVLRVDADGRVMQHGSRQHCCHSSPVLREYSQLITTAMAGHFRDDPYVVGWQTDNEFHCHFSECHCESCRAGFVEFLRNRFGGDIGALNAAWGTAFWAQAYADFDEVPTPKWNRPTYCNPSHVLDYDRYLSHAVTQFQHDQVAILREANADWFIFHNGLFAHIDARGEFTEDLDFLGYDVYPFFTNDPDARRFSQAFNMDRARAWSGNVLVPEQQSGPGGQRGYFHDNPEPGELRRMTYTSIARGADSLLYFRWRTCRFGAEEYWCGILDHDNVPRRRYLEVKQTGEELRRVGPEVLRTSVRVDVGVATSDQSVNDAHSTFTLGLPHHDQIAEGVHDVLSREGYAVGCVHPSDDLSGLKAYIIPHWALFDPAWVPNLQHFVEEGGTLVVGARTATRDVNNNVIGETPPGCLAGLCGCTVEEYGRQNRPDKRPLTVVFGDSMARSELWYEVLEPDHDARVLATWEGRHLTGKAVVTCRNLGRGRVVYVGTYLTANLFDDLLEDLVELCGLEPLWPAAPEGVEVVVRESEGKRLWFFINHNDRQAFLGELPEGVDLITGSECSGSYELEPNGVLVVKCTAET
jgi:beta-galactosidase